MKLWLEKNVWREKLVLDERKTLSTPSFDYFKTRGERGSGKEGTAEDVETLLRCVSAVPRRNHADGFEIDFGTVNARDCKICNSCCSPTPYTHLSGHTSGTLVCQPPSRHPSIHLWQCEIKQWHDLKVAGRPKAVTGFSPRFFQAHETWERLRYIVYLLSYRWVLVLGKLWGWIKTCIGSLNLS